MRLICLISLICLTFLATAQECGVIYCSPSGPTTAAATKSDPIDLMSGLALANSTNPTLHLQEGTYLLNHSLQMPSNVAIVGGFDSNWSKSNAATTTIFRKDTLAQSGPDRIIAVECVGVSNFRLQDLTIRTANALGSGISTYAVYLRNCADYEITRCKILSGNAGHGGSGAAGLPGMNGASGLLGDGGMEDEAGNNSGGAAGSGSFVGSNAGGAGGDGGPRGTYEAPAGGTAPGGNQGVQGEGIGGGNGGFGGTGNFTAIFSIDDILTQGGCSNTTANFGFEGVDGGDGVTGQFGDPGVASFGGGFYLPQAGTSGEEGSHGSGGGGGGGGGAQGGIVWLDLPLIGIVPPGNVNGTGAGGGGGGEGGQGGSGGSGGQGGGGSFALFAWDNGFNGVIKDCEIQAGLGGFGGAGGFGGSGGSGGDGGDGGDYPPDGDGEPVCDIGSGGDGGNGGNGGTGGQGGSGSEGVGLDLYQDQNGQPLVLQNIYGLAQPLVSVVNPGCIGSPIQFEVDATGTAQWFFGAGAEPYSQTGLTAVTSYQDQGLKTFTLVLNGVAYTYTDFIRIWQNAQAPPPQINTTTTDLCEGDGGFFSSSVASENYIWELSTDADTVVFEGANLQQLSTVVFDTAQSYQLTLRTESNCCGISFADTVMIEVDSVIPPQINIQSDLTGAAVGCLNGDITFTASAIDVGPDPTYQWTVNGGPAGGDQPVFTTNVLVDGDQVNCSVISSLGCATGMSVTAVPIQVDVVAPPTVTCEIDSFLAEDPTHFVATVGTPGVPPYEYFWNFGDGTFGFGEDVYHIYDEGGTYTVNLTLVDSVGCEAYCQSNINITSDLSADFSVDGNLLDSLSGCAPLQIQFENNSANAVTYFWDFGDGESSTEFEPTHTYEDPGSYTVSMSVYSASGNDSASIQNLIHIHPTPVASFIPMQINPGDGADTVQFADNSLFATSWSWDFDDPNSAENTSDISNPIHVFSQNGFFNVSLVVTNQFGCTDTIIIPHSVNVGVEELDEAKFQVFPNPSMGELNLSFAEPLGAQAVVEVRDQTSRLIRTLALKNSGSSVILDLTELSSGVYQVSIITKAWQATQKVILSSNGAE